MTPDTPLPTDLRQWVTRHLPGLDTVVDASWPRGCARIWRVAAGTDEVYVKLGLTEKDYAREVRAYEHAGRFAPHEVPRLLAADPDLRAIMTSPVPGLVVRELPLTVEVETRVHELAGRLLRRWHDLPGQITEQARDAIRASVAEQADVAQLEVWGFTQRRTDGVHLTFRAPRGGTVRVLRSLMGRADAGVVTKAARLAGTDVAQFWAGPSTENDNVEADVADAGVVAELGARRVSATRDRIIALVLGVHTTVDRPLGFDQVVALCPDGITRDQARTASAVLCRDGQLERIRSGVYQWADGVRARRLVNAPTRPAAAAPARPAAPAVTSAPPARPARPSSAELFERLFPRGVRMTAELLADFEQWAELTEKLTAYANAS